MCYHKPYIFPPDNKVFLPIQGGKAISNLDLHIQGDNEVNGHLCNNISAKNESYCELTVLYWAWKNLKKLCPDVKYIGLFHYRRFFDFDENQVIRTLESGKIIIAQKSILKYSLRIQYSIGHVSEDYRILCRIIKEKFQDYYDAFITVMEKNNKISFCNMFIMKYEDFVKYCEWLFAVLSEVEPLVPYQHYNASQKRVFGFMAERLFNVYIHKHNIKTEQYDVYTYPNIPKKKNLIKRVYDFLRCCHSNIAFWFTQEKFIKLKQVIKNIP